MMAGKDVFAAAAPDAAGSTAKHPAPQASKKRAVAPQEDAPKDPLATGLAAWDLEPPSVVVRRRAKRL